MAQCPICGKKFVYSFNKANDGTQVCGGDDSCKIAYNKILLSNRNSGNNSDQSNAGANQSQAVNEEAKANAEQAKAQAAEAKAQAAEAKSLKNAAKWNAAAQFGTAAFSALNSTGKEVKETTDYLAKIVFSSDPEELGNQLNEISSMWGGAEKYMINANTEAVKKAAFEKFEFGFMKLQQVGMPHQIEFFTKKQKEMKPKRFGFF